MMRPYPIRSRAQARRSAVMTVVGTKPHPIFLAGRWVESPDVLEVANPAEPASRPARRTTPPRRSTRRPSRRRSRAFEVTRTPARLRARPDPARDQRRDQGPPRGARPAHRPRGRQADPRRAGRGRPGVAHVPAGCRGGRADDRRAHPARPACRRRKDRVGITRRFPIGPIAGDQPVQLPAQPRRAQARAGDRQRATRSCSSRRPRTRSRC